MLWGTSCWNSFSHRKYCNDMTLVFTIRLSCINPWNCRIGNNWDGQEKVKGEVKNNHYPQVSLLTSPCLSNSLKQQRTWILLSIGILCDQYTWNSSEWFYLLLNHLLNILVSTLKHHQGKWYVMMYLWNYI